ncbi:MAG: hydroxymethylglutaryl-CoA synthase [Anaerolineae bacterium]|nr:MAG: hydroxymethylglutaryl-CoA synthase [Anaerolineae bacterium]
MTTEPSLMKPNREVGIVGYGAYVPRYRLPASEVARVWTDGVGGLPITEKAVPGLDEDTATMGLEAARNALARAGIDPARIRAVWVGSESHPYAVKPTGTVVAEAIGATPNTLAGDWEFACKAGTEALQAAIALVGSGMGDYALAIGADTAQGRPGDALEYTTGAGAAAYIVGPGSESLVLFEATYSHVTDTPDFFRRPYQHFPQHGSRFTGQPAYFEHSLASSRALLEGLGRQPEDYAYAIFHQPNARFPQRAARSLGFTQEQIAPGLLVPVIGNTYAGSSLMGLTAVLDVAKPGDKIFLASYGSGAGSDAFSFVVTDAVLECQKRAPATQAYIARRKEIDYATYVRYRRKLHEH